MSVFALEIGEFLRGAEVIRKYTRQDQLQAAHVLAEESVQLVEIKKLLYQTSVFEYCRSVRIFRTEITTVRGSCVCGRVYVCMTLRASL